VTSTVSAPATSTAPAGDVVVAVRDVHYAAGGRPIFAGLDLEVRRGRITAIMGPSGTGKTTLLRLVTAQVAPTQGQVTVFGKDLASFGRSEIYALRHRMGMLFQNGALLTDLDVFENVAFPVREHTDLPEPLLRLLVLTKLQAVGLRGAADLMPGELSGGMARRVALARAIVMDPEVLLYDEPFVGLDPISLGFILRLIKHMNQALGITSVVVSHDVQELATIADDSYLISEGRVAAAGTPAQLRASDSAAVRQFMTGSADGPVPFHYPAPDYATQLLEADER
jgi:phospholipid/cholesterol/gamma-HCH transport system ATP-binding protein